MKKYLTALSLLIITFNAGCSSVYTIYDFPSKEKFYKDFNSFAENKSLIVTLINDSSFTMNCYSKITADTLFFVKEPQNGESEIKSHRLQLTFTSIPIINVKKISYKKYWPGGVIGMIAGPLAGAAAGSFYLIGGGHSTFTGTPVVIGAAA